MNERKRPTKTQRDLLELCAKRPPAGLTVDIVWVADTFCGVTEACEMAAERSARTQELPALGHSSSNGAWDALRTLAQSASNPGTCYSNLARAAVLSHSERSKNGCVFTFDNAASFMDCSSVDLSNEGAGRASKWEKVVTAFEDAQRWQQCPVRLIFFVYKTSILIRRNEAGRYIGTTVMRMPRLGQRFKDRVTGWEWTRNGLSAVKAKSQFTYFETVEAESTGRVAARA